MRLRARVLHLFVAGATTVAFVPDLLSGGVLVRDTFNERIMAQITPGRTKMERKQEMYLWCKARVELLKNEGILPHQGVPVALYMAKQEFYLSIDEMDALSLYIAKEEMDRLLHSIEQEKMCKLLKEMGEK